MNDGIRLGNRCIQHVVLYSYIKFNLKICLEKPFNEDP